jgi:hypothetical protein
VKQCENHLTPRPNRGDELAGFFLLLALRRENLQVPVLFFSSYFELKKTTDIGSREIFAGGIV